MRSACSLPAADACRGGREEAVSIQLGQPYSEGIRHVIQPLPGQARGGGAEPALTMERELTAGCLLTQWICLPRRAGPIHWPCRAKHSGRSSSQKAPGCGSEHVHVQNSSGWKSWGTPDHSQPGQSWKHLLCHTQPTNRVKSDASLHMMWYFWNIKPVLLSAHYERISPTGDEK